MNPSGGGLFGASPQGGAFQVPSGGNNGGSNKPGLFQSAFGSQPQSAAFFQSGTFPQPTMTQGHTPTVGGPAGSTTFGLAPSFGQTASLGQSAVFGQSGSEPATPMSQAFGQSSSMFGAGGGSAPAFGQVSGAVFGQTPAFGQQSAFGQQPPPGQQPAFGQQPPSGFGQQQQPSGFSLSSAVSHTTTGSTSTAASFGHTPFGQPLSTSSSSSGVFGSTVQGAPSGVFGSKAQGAPSGVFGSTAVQGAPSGVFGSTAVQGASSGVFGSTAVQGASSGVFGSTAVQGASSGVFGSTAVQGASSGVFGSTAVQGASSGVFGSTAVQGAPSGVFGSTAVQGAPSGVFGGTAAQAQAASSGVFGGGGAVAQGFSFKPSNEALFKPIFSASPEPPASNNPEPGGGSSEPSHSASSGGMESSAPPAPPPPLGFSFSQPANVASAQKEPPQPSSVASTGLQFTFSQPAAPCSTSTAPSTTSTSSTTQPTTPSSFSFSAKVIQPQMAPLFGASGFGQAPAFGDPKAKDADAEERSAPGGKEAPGELNPFATRPSKGTKRKESPVGPAGSERASKEESTPTEGESPRQPQKRPLLRSRGPTAGLFGRALSGVMKEARREPGTPRDHQQQQQQQPSSQGQADSPAQGGQQGAPAPSRSHAPTREVLERELQTGSPKAAVAAAEPEPEATPPARRCQRAESTEGLSPGELGSLTALQCKNVPPQLNTKELLMKHFSQYGAVKMLYCRPGKKLAIVHFHDHDSAAKAKKRGKNFHRHELCILWQRKKQSPAEKGKRPASKREEGEMKAQSSSSSSSSSPVRRPTAPPRVPPVSSTFARSSPVKKPAAAKALQMDSDGGQQREEPGPEALPPSSASSERPVPSSILPLIGQLAETAEEKYRLLEQRDKILRQGRPKRTDLDMSKVFVGTCPDMCPEKERYMRETRNQLSAFEVLPDTEMVDHQAAIKEYSRSSADQEEPLPHELRPLPVLSRTMDYLVTQILDQPRESTRDWYDFVWNRTRGIRKDITQQHLCCPLTVSLIEKCTRFHVHCAHHLCEERLMTFDTKINNENMTKCLQSLKEMYQDLATRNVYCPQEAEFRQYNILVKLDDGDILREVQQYHPDVRNSPDVQFAVQCFSALNSNNFVRFFKLVKSASYTSACLLHRYFNQVRAKALKTLNIAHTVGSQRSTSFPIEDMVRMLMFHNTAEAIDYMTHYGLTVSDGQVELSRTAYQEPEMALSQRRSEVILTKRSVPVGQVVNGGALPLPPQHTPVCSFDAHNRFTGGEPGAAPPPSSTTCPPAAPCPPAPSLFRGTVFAAKPDVKLESDVESWPPVKAPRSRPATPQDPCSTTTLPLEAADVQPQEQPVKLPTPPPPAPVYTDEDIVSVLDTMVEEVLGSEVNEVALGGFAYTSVALDESSVQVEALVSEVVGEELQEVSSNQIRLEEERIAEEKRRLDEARRRQEHEVFVSQYSVSLSTELLQEVLEQSITETAAQQIREAQEEKEELISRCTEEECSALLDETLEADIALLVENVLRAELQRIHKYIKRWLDVVAFRRQLKRQMRGFPAAPCCVDPRFKLKALAPSAPQRPCLEQLARGLVNLGNAGTVSFSSTRSDQMRQEAMHQMRVQYYFQQLLNERVWRPLDLPALVMENIPNPSDRIYWKTTLLLPGDHDGHTSLEDRILSDWLEAKLGGDKSSEVTEKCPDGALQTLYVSNTLHHHDQRTHSVHVSIKVSRGPLSEDSLLKVEERQDLQGTGGLVLLLPAQAGASLPGQEDGDVALLSALLQLRQLQQVSSWHCPLPLVILVPGGACGGAANAPPQLEEALMLGSLVEEGLVSEYTLIYIPETTSDLQGSQQVKQAMAWLLSRSPPSIHMCGQTLVQLVESTLTREFTSRLCAHHAQRRSSALGPEAPGPIISLYNAVLEHLAELVSSKALASLSWPPGEFSQAEPRHLLPHVGWNSDDHLAWLRHTLLSLHIPPWQPEPSQHASWSELCSSIYQYCSLIPASDHTAPLLMSRLDHLLHSVSLQGGSQRTPQRTPQSPTYQHIPWDDIVLLCIDHKMKDWPPTGPPVCEGSVTEDGEVLVYFLSETLGGFQPPEEWSQAVRRTHTLRQQMDRVGAEGGGPPTSSSTFRSQMWWRSRLDPVPSPAPPPLDITHTPSALELLPQRVLDQLQEESALSHRSTEQLQDWLNADPVEHLATPLFMPSSTLLATPTWTLPTHHSATNRPPWETKPEEPSRKTPPSLSSRGTAVSLSSRGTAPSLSSRGTAPSLSSRGTAVSLSSRGTAPSLSSRGTAVSLSRRLQDLQRQIAAGQEEELSFRLKLDNLMSIVDD